MTAYVAAPAAAVDVAYPTALDVHVGAGGVALEVVDTVVVAVALQVFHVAAGA